MSWATSKETRQAIFGDLSSTWLCCELATGQSTPPRFSKSTLTSTSAKCRPPPCISAQEETLRTTRTECNATSGTKSITTVQLTLANLRYTSPMLIFYELLNYKLTSLYFQRKLKDDKGKDDDPKKYEDDQKGSDSFPDLPEALRAYISIFLVFLTFRSVFRTNKLLAAVKARKSRLALLGCFRLTPTKPAICLHLPKIPLLLFFFFCFVRSRGRVPLSFLLWTCQCRNVYYNFLY